MIGGLLKSTSSAALFAAVGLFALGAGVPAATAADLGGDCCADLEERVAELEATTARKGNRRVSLTVSGQVSTALMAWNDGENSDTYVVDNVPSGGTFFAFSGSAKINPSLTAGYNVTIALDTGSRSHQVNANDDDGTTGAGNLTTGPRSTGGFDTDIVLTLANWYLDHSQLGRITVGRINTATAGTVTVDLGGAGVIANAQVGYWQRGFTDPNTGQTWANLLGGNTVNGASLSRANAISYTSPTVGGLSVSAAWGENDVWDAAVRYAGEFSGFRVAAALGYASNLSGLGDVSEERGVTAGGPQPTQIKGSASILHVATGLYLAGAYLNQDNDTAGVKDTTLWYLQGGISKNWTGLGNTVLYGEYGQVDDPVLTGACAGTICGVTSEMWGLGIVQHIDAAAMELFLAYKNFSANAGSTKGVPNEEFNDFDVVMGGGRIRF
jgi:predicted porin